MSQSSIPTTILLCAAFFINSAAAAQHDKQFWRTLLKQHSVVPEHESADALALELSAMLASPDPELRDDLAYSILATWISRDSVLSAPTLISLTDEWRANLKGGLGETGTDSVLKRSFSALCLSEMARREARASFMGPERYHRLVKEATTYLQNERDLRGYDPTLHWIHATAHTADLLAALADSPLLSTEEADRILQSVQSRLSTATEVFTQGEQDRLAIAVVSVIRRKDFKVSTFAPWLAQLQSEDRDVWTATTFESLARYQNHSYFLQGLTVRMLLAKEAAQLVSFRDQVLALLAQR